MSQEESNINALGSWELLWFLEQVQSQNDPLFFQFHCVLSPVLKIILKSENFAEHNSSEKEIKEVSYDVWFLFFLIDQSLRRIAMGIRDVLERTAAENKY